MELALSTDGPLATLRVIGTVGMSETAMLSDYLRVARENGAVRCVLDLSACAELPTTIMAVLMRESARFAEAGGALALCGVSAQNPFLTDAVAAARFFHYATMEEACATERVRALAGPGGAAHAEPPSRAGAGPGGAAHAEPPSRAVPRPIDAAGQVPDNPPPRGEPRQ